jgi:nucleoid DNA-binding protein
MRKERISLSTTVGTGRGRKGGINPKTKATITIPAKNHPVFKAGKTLKDRVAK